MEIASPPKAIEDHLVERALREMLGDADIEEFSLRDLRDLLRRDSSIAAPTLQLIYEQMFRVVSSILLPLPPVSGASQQVTMIALQDRCGINSIATGVLELHDWAGASLLTLRQALEKRLMLGGGALGHQRNAVAAVFERALTSMDTPESIDYLFSTEAVNPNHCIACVRKADGASAYFGACGLPRGDPDAVYCKAHQPGKKRPFGDWPSGFCHRAIACAHLKKARREAKTRYEAASVVQARPAAVDQHLLRAVQQELGGANPMHSSPAEMLRVLRESGELPTDSSATTADVLLALAIAQREYERGTPDPLRPDEHLGRQLLHFGFEQCCLERGVLHPLTSRQAWRPA